MIGLGWSINFIFARQGRGDVTVVQVTTAEVYLRLFSVCSVSYLIVFIISGTWC